MRPLGKSDFATRRSVSLNQYGSRIREVLNRIWETQTASIERISETMAEGIAKGSLVHIFGSGDSVLSVVGTGMELTALSPSLGESQPKISTETPIIIPCIFRLCFALRDGNKALQSHSGHSGLQP
jgi:hypothetical protein